MKKDHSKLSKNEPESIPYFNIIFVKGFERLKIDF